RMQGLLLFAWHCTRALPTPLLLLLYSWLLSARAGGCPLPCDCGQDNSSVSCARRGLANVPVSLPTQTASLDLSGNAIAGIRQSDFSQLPQLVELDLEDNLLSSVEPGTFALLPRLRALQLGGNCLTVLCPDSLQGLNLTSLSITSCNLSSVPYPALGHLVYLQRLDLSYNPIRALGGEQFHPLPRLQDLPLPGQPGEARPG
uniref:LRRNT domain-containing protein n=1 Tax=Callorhinchus milii TaxID=7868 RepID=A0A4W3GIZ9_CALMI